MYACATPAELELINRFPARQIERKTAERNEKVSREAIGRGQRGRALLQMNLRAIVAAARELAESGAQPTRVPCSCGRSHTTPSSAFAPPVAALPNVPSQAAAHSSARPSFVSP